MGSLQSVLGDCQIGELPAYVKEYISKAEAAYEGMRNPEGSEASVVYSPNEQKFSNSGSSHFSGPNHTFVTSRNPMVKDRGMERANEDRKLLSDIVDLVVDGIDSPSLRKDSQTPMRRNNVPGGQVYSVPSKNRKALKTDVWEEAKNRVDLNGTHVKASPLDDIDDYDIDEISIADEARSLYSSKNEHVSEVERHKQVDLMSQSTGYSSSCSVENQQEANLEANEVEGQAQKATSSINKISNRAISFESSIHNIEEKGSLEEDGSKDIKSTNVESAVLDKDINQASPLDTCRQEEAEVRSICHIVALPFEMDDEAEKVTKWYIVEADWFRLWSKFLQGAPRPGPIVNEKLLTENNNRPWPGLLQGEHYFGMDERAWNFLADRYGADIAISRKSYDIYT
mmetsp:Transcript_402/g.389  ORF Transcript_402/g.389 Transcript_402/m.389 type:complete len:398 (-) Transcript_402:67-1260(-)